MDRALIILMALGLLPNIHPVMLFNITSSAMKTTTSVSTGASATRRTMTRSIIMPMKNDATTVNPNAAQ